MANVIPTERGKLFVVLGFETALLFWRAVHAGRLKMPAESITDPLPASCLSSFKDLSRLDLSPVGLTLTNKGLFSCYEPARVAWDKRQGHASEARVVPTGIGLYPGIAQPLHVLTGNRRSLHAHPAVKAHLITGQFPQDSLYRIDEQLLVVSPELAFVQCCHSRHDLPNIEMALELCGTYSLMTAELPCRFDLSALTTVEQIEKSAVACRGRWGATAALRALGWASNKMRSPRESEMYLLIVLDRSLGGFGLPRPSVNVQIRIKGTTAERLTNATYFEVDFVWEDKRVVLEYDGHEEHEADPAKVASDKERRSVLAALGYTVIVVTSRDLANEASLLVKISQLSMALGVDIAPFSNEEHSAHSALFAWLTNPQHDHLPFGCGYH